VPSQPKSLPAPTPSTPAASIEDIVRDLAASDGATFRPATSLFRDFAIRCRQQGVASAQIDLARFRHLFACEIGGLSRLTGATRSRVEAMISGVDDDVLAPYVAMVIAEVLGDPMPDEEELARLYGSSSPSRIRRLLDHLERSGLIVIREEFGGDRIIMVPGIPDPDEKTKAA